LDRSVPVSGQTLHPSAIQHIKRQQFQAANPSPFSLVGLEIAFTFHEPLALSLKVCAIESGLLGK
jgi:hypothetical protein